MALELSDLNDGAILTSTRMVTNEQGHVQFSILLPSGRKIHSEWIPDDKKREALQAWLSAVKDAALADAEEEHAKSRRAPLPEPSPAAPAETLTAIRASSTTTESDPMAWAQSRAKLAAELVEDLKRTVDDLTVKLETARTDLLRWNVIVSSLTGESNNV